jgi:outer membrane protein assembly factor BamB
MSARAAARGLFSRLAGGVAGVILLSAGLSCATAPQGRAGDAREVAAALAHQRPLGDGPLNRLHTPMAFLAYRGPSAPALAAYDLSRSRLVWEVPGALIGRIEVGQDVIVHAAKGDAGEDKLLVGRAVQSGAVLWRHTITADQRLIGYAVDGDVAYYVARAFASSGQHGAGVVVALDTATGAVRWRHELPPGDVGGPAARGGLVAVPVETQYVLLLDGSSGVESARILSTEQAATFVRALPEGVFFGSKGVFHASAETALASRRSAGYAEAILPKFARPTYHHDMYRPEQSDYSAIDRNRVLWRAAVDPAGRMSFRDGLVFVHDFRFFFAMEAATGVLKWAHAEPTSDAVASEDAGPSLVYVTADGELGALDALTGRRIYRAQIPDATMVRGATFDAEGFRGAAGVDATADAAATLAGGETASSPSDGRGLAETLSSILWDTDRRFSELGTFAVEQLGRLPGPAVTADLLKAAQTPSLPPRARKLAEAALAARTDGPSTELLIEALKIHTDYADDRQATSVGAIARAALVSKSKPLALALAQHLLLPETAPATTVLISQALSAIGAVEAVPTLRDFLCLYRGEPAFDADPTPLTAAADALLALGGPADRELLLFMAEQPHTVEPLRTHLQRALTTVQMIPHPPMKAL